MVKEFGTEITALALSHFIGLKFGEVEQNLEFTELRQEQEFKGC